MPISPGLTGASGCCCLTQSAQDCIHSCTSAGGGSTTGLKPMISSGGHGHLRYFSNTATLSYQLGLSQSPLPVLGGWSVFPPGFLVSGTILKTTETVCPALSLTLLLASLSPLIWARTVYGPGASA